MKTFQQMLGPRDMKTLFNKKHESNYTVETKATSWMGGGPGQVVFRWAIRWFID